jgi:Leucine-rich repeat (LRR) protein
LFCFVFYLATQNNTLNFEVSDITYLPNFVTSIPSISGMSDLMASPSSSKPHNYKFKVFSSFHGPDVRKTLLSNLREHFQGKGITMFDDEKIKRGGDLSPSLKRAIKTSKISIVILSQKYASSSWCLDELLEIMKRKKAMKQIVMTVFYGVEPSDVRKQTGDFGIAFNKTCVNKTDKERKEWSKALTDVSNIAGEDFKKWDNEANMIKKIARDVSYKLNATPSKDFEDMMGLEAHLKKIQSLLRLDYKDEALIIGISGPAGIGKSTIARALESRLSDRFQLTCFMDLRGSENNGLHDYGQQLRLQEQLLAKVLNQDGTRICHLGVLQQRLSDLRVLIILDDVSDIKQLKALAKETTWFGPGSRIIVTTENKDLLQQRGIDSTYHVGFPSREEALEIFCKFAFEQSSPPHAFEKLAARITHLCGNLPLGLCVMGSSLFGKKQDEWEFVVHRLETNPGQEIDDVLRVGYERLHENDQMLFLHIAIFFNYRDRDLVEAMLADDGNLDVGNWLKFLINKSLIEIYRTGQIVMHKLLQQVGRQAIRRQEPWKRQILINANEICDLLRYEKGTSCNVSGISFDTSGISEVTICDGAFKRLHDLRFLHVYKSRDDGNNRVHIPEKVEFPPRLRLLHWAAYPSKSLPPTFNLECLVELNMRESLVEKLWEGTQHLKNLKYMDLTESKNLKELPDLSNATNLEYFYLDNCESLVEIPSSFAHLHKLEWLEMNNCINLQVIPAHMNLTSVKQVNMKGCSRLRKFPVISRHIEALDISDNTELEDMPASIASWCHLVYLDMSHNEKLQGLTQLPTSLRHLNLSYTDIESIPDCIKALHQLEELCLSGCTRLASLPDLPCSIKALEAEDCESLESVSSPLYTPSARLSFTNCFKLGGEAREAIIRRSSDSTGSVLLPGREVPAEFDHRAQGNSLSILLPLGGNSQFMVCVVISPRHDITKMSNESELLCRINGESCSYDEEFDIVDVSNCRREHLFIFHSGLLRMGRSEAGTEMVFEFSSALQEDFDIIECGVKIWTPQSIRRGYLAFGEDDDGTDGVICDTEDVDQMTDETKGGNNGGSSDEEDGKIHMYSHESGETSESESESEKEDESEPRETSEADADGDYESVSRKRAKKTTSASTDLKLVSIDYLRISNLLKYIFLILVLLLILVVLMSMRLFLA